MIEFTARLTTALQQAATALQPEFSGSIELSRPRSDDHGELASNLAMQLAKPLKRNPRDVAQQIIDALRTNADLAEGIARTEIAGPGFINFHLHPAVLQQVIVEVEQGEAKFGHSRAGREQPMLVEFVSANPTGPLHVGHGRQGALGDAIAAVLTTQGWAVQREFYYNDAGVQIQTLALSVQARARGYKPGDAQWPESAYNGDYIADIARDFLACESVPDDQGQPIVANGQAEDLDNIRRFAVAYLRREQDLDLKTFGIRFDNYYLESSLYTDGRVEDAVQRLQASGHTYEQDGALWLRTTQYGDDKDRVMRKSDGTYTYFVPDVAYHLAKWQRGFHRAVNIQGSDHHGTIARVRAGLQALDLGIPTGYPDYVLHKMVTVMRGGQEVKISKRAGSYVTVRDLIEWSGGVRDDMSDEQRQAALQRGRDAVRFFLVSRKADTEFVFDVDLALAQSDENPVYYVQYAHARVNSVFEQWAARAPQEAAQPALIEQADLSLLIAPRERALQLTLARYPQVLAAAAQELAPHQVAFYLRDLAADFHAFYNAERVLVDELPLRHARLRLLRAVRQVMHNALAVLGVSAPQRM
ncbi:MAG: arginine--tRNA ligase [Thiomonas arsenitoxydans]|uniref:Arginine--tRNA ligase n=1 Tax=Thiomonas arsenitoxydans (strain DSM 22701 / CIP 110005 / 3As) TaxID=426114 RepID=A0A8I1MV62_THIA3|nr:MULTISPECIES: arginine--tRNA ligase [Thiomonas]MBN8744063.1 arginine--tRNA ligase [Thiomonas arsenitoxydans]ODU96039.1 MAG: arginine--tRNA ligase [Thiomonas sp. SCN 64-16]